MLLLIFIILDLHFLQCQIIANSRTNFKVKSFKLCNNTQGLFKYRGNITKEGDSYYVTSRIVLPIPLDENVGVSCKIESMLVNTYVELFTIRERYFCKAANIYLGEMWYDIQRGAQVIPGTCPLPARRYETHHLKVDFNKVALQTFPFGHLKFTVKAIDNKHSHHNLLCLEMEVENVPN